MYHQFKELADIDITKEPMEVGPTLHYIMGGVRVEPETAASTVRGLFAAGEVAGGMHGSNRLGGNSLSDLLVFGRRAGLAAAQHAANERAPGAVDEREVADAAARMIAPLERPDGEDPYEIQSDLQQTMHELVGIIRTQAELDEAIVRIAALRQRLERVAVKGGRRYNPGWNLALDLRSLLTVSDAVARAAAMRTESRGGHTRDDFPKTDPEWGKKNVVVRLRDGRVELDTAPLPAMPPDIAAIVGEEPHAAEQPPVEATAPAGMGGRR
jgi:succinate dehydrogenase / fumarate reductase flavoprotein subunit